MNAIAFLLINWLGFLPELPILTHTPAQTANPATLTGKVVMLTQAIKDLDLEFDAEPIARQVVVVGDDDAITPLLSSDASRALFQDERLRNRRVEIRGNRFRGLPYVQVVSFRVDDHGKLRTPEYYCEICAISVRFPEVCPCCQGPMELRMKPDEP
jgi:hypothetical protein